MTPKTTNQLAKEAIQVQDACNLRGVILAWHRAITDPVVVRGSHVEDYLNLLYLGKIASLLHADAESIGDATLRDANGKGNDTTWRMAYEWACKQAEED